MKKEEGQSGLLTQEEIYTLKCFKERNKEYLNRNPNLLEFCNNLDAVPCKQFDNLMLLKQQEEDQAALNSESQKNSKTPQKTSEKIKGKINKMMGGLPSKKRRKGKFFFNFESLSDTLRHILIYKEANFTKERENMINTELTEMRELIFRFLLGKLIRPQGKGTFFGERALDSEKGRTASVVTETQCL